MSTAKFIYANSYINLDLYYATKFLAFDPFAYFEHRGKKYIVIDVLEYGRAKRQAKVDKVLLVSDYKKDVELRKGSPAGVVDILNVVFKKFGIKKLEVPSSFPLALAKSFEAKKYKLSIGSTPFYPERVIKTEHEKQIMIAVQKKVFKLIGSVEEILTASKISGNKVMFEGKALTSEFLKEHLSIMALKMRLDMSEEPIVSCGVHACDPHDTGTGLIRPNQSIIVDVFPRSKDNFYWGDATRTFCKGRATSELKKLYDTVKKGQEIGFQSIKDGVNGRAVNQKIADFFASQGYKSGKIDGFHQGVIHGTGHGIGLELHEFPPSISSLDCTLRKGYVTSVEPGLYYRKIGGVRIEDCVYVTKKGCEILAGYPKKLEIL